MYSVLYVDDEPDLLEVAKLFLEGTSDLRVDTLISAREALTALGTGSYDAVVSDYQMPGMDGIAFLKAVRQQYGDIPFILFTGRGREEVVIAAINSGADFYLQKGGDPTAQFAELAHKVKQAIRRKRAETTVAEQERRVHDLQNASDLIHSLSPDGRFLFVNRKWLDTLGYTEEDVKNLTLSDILDESAKEHCQNLFARVLAGENVGIIDAVFKARDGSRVFVEGLSSCKFVDGQPQYTRGVFKDVTDRKRVERELAESQDFLSRIYSSVNAGIVIIDTATHAILDLNPAAERMIGAPRDQILGKACHQFICPAETGKCPITDLHQTVDNSERVLIRADGQKLHIIKYVVPFHYHGKDCLLETFVDNTERKKTLDDLHAAYEQLTATEEELRENYDELGRQEQALRESEEKFHGVFNNANDAIYIHIQDADGPGQFLEVNDFTCTLLGYSREELLKKRVMDVLSSAHRRDVPQITKKITEVGYNTFYAEFKRKDGSTFPVEVNTHVYRFSGRDVVLAIARDITERERAEQALRESEKKYRDIIENMQDVVYRTDRNGKLVMFSQYGVKLAGYSSEKEMIGLDIALDTYHDPKDRERFLAALAEKGHVENYPLVLKARDGKLRMVTTSSHYYYDEQGNVLGIEGIIHDYTERWEAEQALHESEKKYRDLFELNTAVMLIVDPGSGRIVDANTAACRYYGYTREELTGLPIAEINIARPDSVKSDMSRAAGARGEMFHFRHRMKSGEVRDVEVFSAPILIAGKKLLHSIVHDVSTCR